MNRCRKYDVITAHAERFIEKSTTRSTYFNVIFIQKNYTVFIMSLNWSFSLKTNG